MAESIYPKIPEMKNNLVQLQKLLKEYDSDPNYWIRFHDPYERDDKYFVKDRIDQQKSAKYCFKMCINNILVVMKKLKDTVTNEDRKDVVYKSHAKFRANKLYVVKLIDTNTLKEIDGVVHTCWATTITGKKITYKKGDIVEADFFDPDLDKVCTNGIHYFLTVERAFYHRYMPLCWTGHWKDWFDNGSIYLSSDYIRSNVIKRSEWNEKGERNGKWIECYPNGKQQWIGTYFLDKKHEGWIECYPSGKQKLTGYYDKDKKIDVSSEYDEYGTIIAQTLYDEKNRWSKIDISEPGITKQSSGYIDDNCDDDTREILISEIVFSKGNEVIQAKSWNMKGEKHGQWLEKNSEGNIVLNASYLNGIIVLKQSS